MKKSLHLVLAFLLALGLYMGYKHMTVKTLKAPMDKPQQVASSSQSSKGQEAVQSQGQGERAQATSEIVEQELNVANGDQRIVGKLLAPKGYEGHKLPLVILSHGFGNTYDFIEPYAEKLAYKGYLVYIFDFIGGSHSSRSGGAMTDMSVFTEEEDLTAVLDTLGQESYVDASRIFLAGYSQGGVVSALTAADNPAKVKGLITLNGAFVLFNDARQLFASKGDIPETYNHRGTVLGRVYFERLLDFDLNGHLSKFQGPSLIIQGNQDDIVPMSEAEAARDALKNSQLIRIDGAGHILNEDEADQAIGATLAFLKENE